MSKQTTPTPQTNVITPDEFRQSLKDQGITLKSWAESHGYDSEYCSRVLGGLVKGVRGKGHEIKVAMGIKANPAESN